MRATKRTDGESHLPSRFAVRRDRLAVGSHTTTVFLVLACAWAFFCTTVAGQDLLVLGQSPASPLLDDSESGSWLNDASDAPVYDQGMPESVVDGSFAPAAGSNQPSTAAADFGYGGGAVGDTWPADNGAIDAGIYGETVQCPDCGGSLATVCPSCLPGLNLGSGLTAPRARGLAALCQTGPIAGCRDMLQPLTRESWLYRPFSAGWFMGFMQGTELVEDWVGQEQGFFGGYRFGWDIDPYWGWETRFGFASVALSDSGRAEAAQAAADLAAGITPSNPHYHRFDTRRDSGIRLWDVDLLWYPYGDTYLRPYFLIGLGTARVDFMDRLSDRRIKSVLAMPIGMGFKYRLRDWLALRVQATDNFIAGAGSGFKNLHNFSLTAGLEVRFGGTRTAYWPYHPGRHYW